MNNNTTKTLIFIFAVLLCFSAVGSCFALYTLNAEPISITITAKLPATLTSISASLPQEYTINATEELDTSQFTITATYSDDTIKEIPVNECSFTGYVQRGSNNQEITISYQGKETTIDVYITTTPLAEYSVLGINGDWTVGIPMIVNPSNANEYMLIGQSVPAGTSLKIYQKSTKAYFGTLQTETSSEGYTTSGTDDNIVISTAARYSFYYKPGNSLNTHARIFIGRTLYLVPNSNWKIDNARFAAYYFGNGDGWASMADTDGDGIYEVAIPKGYTKVIFCRMTPSSSANNWDNKWNQTGDLTIPTNGNNLFTIPSGAWDGSTTTWSTK